MNNNLKAISLFTKIVEVEPWQNKCKVPHEKKLQFYFNGYLRKNLSQQKSDEWKRIQLFSASGLNPSNYEKWFSTQLFLEEIREENDLVHLQNVHIEHSKNRIKFVLPNRRSKLLRPALKEKDSVYMRNLNRNMNYIYEGIVYSIDDDIVYIDCNKKLLTLLEAYSGRTLVDIQFWPCRVSYQRCHAALELYSEIEHFVFPNILSNDNCQDDSTIELEFFNERIGDNKEQRNAIKAIVSNSNKNAPYILFGPPGTGKTSTVVEAIKQVYSTLSSSRILVSCPSNSACDVVAERLLDDIPERDLLRLNAVSREVSDIPKTLRSVSNIQGGEVVSPSKDSKLKERIIISTFICSAQVIRKFNMKNEIGTFFTHVFLDECGQGTEPQTLVPMLGCTGNLILAGDPFQLGPVITNSTLCSTSQEKGIYFAGAILDQSLLERLMTTDLYKPDSNGKYDVRYISKLVDNYRSHAALLKIPNKLFYESQLVAKGKDVNMAKTLNCLPNKKMPLIFHGVNGDQERENHSYYNTNEADIVFDYLRILLDQKVKAENIGVISPYRKQIDFMKERRGKLLPEASKVLFGSPEDFQGKEKQVSFH